MKNQKKLTIENLKNNIFKVFKNVISLISDFLFRFCLSMLCSIVANFGTYPLGTYLLLLKTIEFHRGKPSVSFLQNSFEKFAKNSTEIYCLNWFIVHTTKSAIWRHNLKVICFFRNSFEKWTKITLHRCRTY